MTRVVAVVGSVTPPGRLRRAVADAVERTAALPGIETELIDLGERTIGFADGRPPEAFGDDTASTMAALAAANAVVLATPVYRGSLTGSLKNLLDHVAVEALQGKPVALVSMGASPHHHLGADRHLRDVLAFFGAQVTPVSVYLTSADFEDGVPGPEAAAELDLLLANLVATAAALRAVTGGPVPLAARRR